MSRRVRIAVWGRIVFSVLYLVAIVIQFIAAGYGFFKGDFDFHEGFGWSVAHILPLLILIATLVLWQGGAATWLAVGVGVLGILQPFLASAGGWTAAFHPLNALILFVLTQMLLRRDLVGACAAPPVQTASATP